MGLLSYLPLGEIEPNDFQITPKLFKSSHSYTNKMQYNLGNICQY